MYEQRRASFLERCTQVSFFSVLRCLKLLKGYSHASLIVARPLMIEGLRVRKQSFKDYLKEPLPDFQFKGPVSGVAERDGEGALKPGIHLAKG